MHPRNTSRSATSFAVAGLLLASAGCGPIAFNDASALAITGTPPAVAEPEPEPPPTPKRVEVREDRIVINEKIQFEVDSAKIREVSYDLLNEIAQVIKQNTQIKKLEIQGHASSEGGDAHNLKLSDKRAKAVLDYLAKKGAVEKSLLSAKGYGSSEPIASNDTEQGREQNRRVEFVITEQEVTKKKVEIDASGKETVLEETKEVSK